MYNYWLNLAETDWKNESKDLNYFRVRLIFKKVQFNEFFFNAIVVKGESGSSKH